MTKTLTFKKICAGEYQAIHNGIKYDISKTDAGEWRWTYDDGLDIPVWGDTAATLGQAKDDIRDGIASLEKTT